MSQKPTETTIQTLLEAEEAAKTAIATAREARDIRLKQAATEADAEIASYRAGKEEEYQAQVKAFVGATGAVSDEIAAGAKKAIGSTIKASAVNKPAVIDMLVSYVVSVDTDLN